ncbi:Uncharacterized protein FKW44_011398, partial [Caligus rogercresseyi]
DRVDIISMNPNGLWKGKCEGRIGNLSSLMKSFYVVPKSQSISNLNASAANSKKVRHDSRDSEQESDEDEDTVDGDDEVVCSSSQIEIMMSESEIPKTVEGLLKSI